MKNKIITAQQAVDLIPDGATIMMGGFVGCGSALSIILLMFVLLSMTFMKKAERKTSDEGGGRLW